MSDTEHSSSSNSDSETEEETNLVATASHTSNMSNTGTTSIIQGILPPKFNVSADKAHLITAWKEYKADFDMYFLASGQQGLDDKQKVAMLLYQMGKQFIRVYNTDFVFDPVTDRDKYNEIIKKFDEYFEPKKLVKGYITKFQQRKQGPTETIAEYVTELRELAKLCQFGDNEENMIAVQLSNGVRDEQLRKKLWDEDLTLQKTIEKCQSFELRSESFKLYSSEQGADVNYSHRGSSRGRHRGRARGNWNINRGKMRGRGRGPVESGSDSHGRTQRNSAADSCSRCGTQHEPRCCPAYGKTCAKCGKRNHFARRCKTKNNVNVVEHEVAEYEYPYDTETSYVWSANTHNQKDMHNWTVNLKSGNKVISFKIDTGAEVNIISRNTYESLWPKPPLKQTSTGIFGLGKQKVSPLGETNIEVEYKGVKHALRCIVIQTTAPNLLSLQDSVNMNLVTRVYEVKRNPVLPESVTKCMHQSTVDIIKEYIDVFTGIGKVPGEVELKVNPEVAPVAQPPRPIPIALQAAVKTKLDQLVTNGIIEKVPIGEPTPWCSALHIVPKKDGSVRITIDPKDLNKALQREYHPTNTVDEVAQRCGKARYFTVLDANQGYFQLQLAESSRNLTVFNTPFGRYRYKRLPMGVTSAPELFVRIFGDIFAGIEGLEMIVDDFLIEGDTIEEHNRALKKTLLRARENHVTFSLRKLQLCKNEVRYSGHKFTDNGMKMDEEKIKAVLEMPTPKGPEDVERLLGMVTYVGKYLKNLSATTEPLRELVKDYRNGEEWKFGKTHETALEKIKELMTTAPVLKYYSLTEPIVISGDASQAGLGCVLLQDNRPVAYGSKALTTAEKAYAQIEKEMLAIVFAVKKFHTYIYGRSDVTVETDHLPLVRIFEKPLHQIPLRLQKMRMRLQAYDFKLVAKKGTEIPVADALSRAFVKETGPSLTGEDSHIFTVTTQEIPSILQTSSPRLKKIRQATAVDLEMQTLKDMIHSPHGWPSRRSDVDPKIKVYYDFREELSEIEGIIFRGGRIVIPKEQRRDALDMLHASHQGMVKTKQLGRDLVYWPGMNKQVEDVVSRCGECQENRARQQKEPLLPMPVPTRPWEHLATDLFDCLDRKWLICVDYYSEYFEIEQMTTTDSTPVIKQTKKWFATHGIPDIVTSDNGPPFSSAEYSHFADKYGFKHDPISPKHSQANGLVEKAVGIAKKMLIKCHASGKDPYLALLNIRNTPRDDETGSPAQRLFARRTATRIPTARSKLKPEVKTPENVTTRLYQDRHSRAKKYYNQHTKLLPKLDTSDTVRVRVKNKWKPAQLLPDQTHMQRRSYKIRLPSGRETRRNRRDLLRTNETGIYLKEEDPIDWPETSIMPKHKSSQANNSIRSNQICQTTPSPTPATPQSLTPPLQFAPAGKTPVLTRSGRVSKPPPGLNDFVK